jgi:hypothetical protein
MSAYWPVPWHFIVKVDLGNDIRGVEETRRSQPVRPVGYVAFKIQFSAAEGRVGRHINADATLSIRLLPRVFDGEAPVRPWMKDARRERLVGDQLLHPVPRKAVFLAAPPKRTTPEVGQVMPER